MENIKFTYMRTPLYRYTFKNKKIRKWVEENVEGNTLNLFAGKYKLNCNEIRNDIRVDMPADYHMDALEFVKRYDGEKFDTVVLDPPYCYDEKTEVLTEDGWKFFKDLKNEKIATLNPNTHQLEYHNYIDFIKTQYNGKMVKIKSGSIDLLVTPNHNLYVRKLWKTNNFQLVEANKVDFGFEFKCDCNWDGEEKEYFILPKVDFDRHNRYNQTSALDKKIKMDDWLKFLGIYLAEGSVDHNGVEYRIRIAQKKEENRKIIEDWINSVGYHYLIDKNGFTIYNKQLCVYLRQFGRTKEKFIPKEFKKLSKRQLNILLEAMVLGDGHKKRKKRWNKKYNKYYIDSHFSYTSYSKKLIDDISEIVLKLGYVPIFYKKEKTNGGGSINITKHRKTPIIRKKKL